MPSAGRHRITFNNHIIFTEHHVQSLASQGLIELAETRKKRGTTERYYRAVGRQFALDSSLLAAGGLAQTAGLANVLVKLLDNARERVLAALDPAGQGATPPLLVGQALLRGTRAQQARFRERLVRLMQEVERDFAGDAEAHGDGPGQPSYGLTVAFYPATDPDGASKEG